MNKQKLPKGWKEFELGEVLQYEQPGDYIVDSDEYKDDDKTPVLTAGKTFILGYTDETKGVYTKLPVIIFDDFTTANHFVTFPFKVKSSAMKLLTPKMENINLKFVYSMMKGIHHNTITHKRYYISAFQPKNIPIPVKEDGTPDLKRQEKIIEFIEKAEKAKEWRKESDGLTKDFLKSVFLEMFGDPERNNKKWPLTDLKEIADFKRDSIVPEKISEDDYYLGLEHIESQSGRILKSEKAKNIGLKSNKFIFDNECLLYGKLRPYLNKVALPNFKGVCSTDIIPLHPIKEKSNKYFLTFLLRHNYIVGKANAATAGANLPRISPKSLEKFKVYSPPIELQNKFASIVKEVEKLKQHQKKSREQIDNLFNALMQKAFKGELIT